LGTNLRRPAGSQLGAVSDQLIGFVSPFGAHCFEQAEGGGD
jgi:hypothetical protein